jgi:hypothetical protein
MSKLTKLLAASFGGGLVLGAGIRLGEALANREKDGGAIHSGEDPDARIVRRIDEQAAEVAAMRSKLDAGSRQIAALGEMGARLHTELPEWIEKSVARRVEEAEASLKAEGGRSQQEALEGFIDGIQTRVAHRVSRLEEEVSMHSTALTELRAYSLRTEASVDKLANSLERFLAAQVPSPSPGSAPPEPAGSRQPSAAPEDPPARPRRRGIFG